MREYDPEICDECPHESESRYSVDLVLESDLILAQADDVQQQFAATRLKLDDAEARCKFLKYLALALASYIVIFSLIGCQHQAATARPPQAPIAAAQGSTTETAADVSDAAKAVQLSAAEMRKIIQEGIEQAIGLSPLWNRLSAQAGRLERTSEVLTTKDAAFTRLQASLSEADKQLKTIGDSVAARDQTITDLKNSTSREAERASAWGVVAGGILCAAGVTLMLITQSPVGKGLALGGLVLSGAAVATIQLFRAGDAIAPLLPWAFGVIGLMFLGWLGWELWSRRTQTAAYATELEKRAADTSDPAEAVDLRKRATALWRSIDATYDGLWQKVQP